MSKSNHIGIYENLPRGRQQPSTTKSTSFDSRQSNREPPDNQVNFNQFNSKQDKDKTFTTTNTTTGEKPSSSSSSIGNTDSWFSKSFVNAGGLSMTNTNGVVTLSPTLKSSCTTTDNPFLNMENQHSASIVKNNNNISGKMFTGGSESTAFFQNLSANQNNSNADSINNNNNISSTPAMKYRGCKTSPLIKTSTEDWDFLTSLNDILRKENFLSDSEQSEYNHSNKVLRNTGMEAAYNNISPGNIDSSNHFGRLSSEKNRGEQNSQRFFENNNETGVSSSLVQIPMSPRPPRPARRRKDFMKARSMNLDGVLTVPSGTVNVNHHHSSSHDILPPPHLFSNDCDMMGSQRPQQQQQQQTFHQQNLSQIQNQSYTDPRGMSPSRHYPKQQQQMYNNSNSINFHTGQNTSSMYKERRSPTPPPPLPSQSQLPNVSNMNLPPRQCLSTAMSSSLDSIYDRLRSVDDYEQNGSNMNQKLFPQVSNNRQRYSGDISTTSHRLSSDFSRPPYNSNMFSSNNMNTSYDNSNILPSSNPNWSHYHQSRPQDDFQLGPYNQQKMLQDNNTNRSPYSA